MSPKVLPEKMYYSIAEVAGYFGIPEHTLRYWEKEFDILAPKRTESRRQIRAYTGKDIHNIEIIHHLLKVKGLTIQGAKEQLKQNPREIDNRVEIIRRLTEIRNELKAISKELDNF